MLDALMRLAINVIAVVGGQIMDVLHKNISERAQEAIAAISSFTLHAHEGNDLGAKTALILAENSLVRLIVAMIENDKKRKSAMKIVPHCTSECCNMPLNCWSGTPGDFGVCSRCGEWAMGIPEDEEDVDKWKKENGYDI